ncbi:unnamed protein product [Paramecium sonneborni]|uniref:TLDc domain-containing protein n=1 Tax=Paramecium sonneborni TaxID=65129 RepID=A0A8S1KC29_9CILI|nr:unnamed protein product [Paramecium sonneborni]
MKERQKSIYCEDDQHFHKGEMIKYLMIKKDKGTIKRRLFCDECYLGKYSSYQQYCCDIQELINGNIFEAFKNTKFDSDKKQEFFNYAKNHFPYLSEKFIQNMITRLREELTSIIDDLEILLYEKYKLYLADVEKWAKTEALNEYFDCKEFKEKFLDGSFQRSPFKFEELNKTAEEFVAKINTTNDDKMKIDIEKIISTQKQFFNLDRFNVIFNELLQSIETMKERTFSDYKFSKSSLATPYLEKIIQKIAPGNEENFHKAMNRIYRFTQNGSNYQKLQEINELQIKDTITIIQTKNKSIFGVYNCKAFPQNSILFQMNKEKYFQLKLNKQALKINLNADLSSWIINFGEGDILINSTFTKCTSNLGNGFDISGSDIWNNQEYLSDCLLFDIYDIEIFEVQAQEPYRQQQVTNPSIGTGGMSSTAGGRPIPPPGVQFQSDGPFQPRGPIGQFQPPGGQIQPPGGQIQPPGGQFQPIGINRQNGASQSFQPSNNNPK